MSFGVGAQVLRKTKLYRPRVTADLVERPRLKERLDHSLDHPLIMVSAPAGFGKSTLLSSWLETCDRPCAWLSLDEDDNDLGVFVAYFLAAMQTIFPDALAETRAFLTGINLPAVDLIASSLINELDGLESDFILVLDDYHTIREQPIHELVSMLLQPPQKSMRLVITTRQDPALPLGVLRAHDHVTEIRAQDLRFSQAEIAAFVERTLGAPLTNDGLAVLTEKTEGWAAGLRLAALALRHGGDIDSHIAGLRSENRYIVDYLLSEVISHVSPAISSFLMKTSILDQMCVSLCEEVVGPDYPACEPQDCLAWLEQAGMFTVALAVESREQWYRYHHFFQRLLQDRLAEQHSASEIAILHARASAWYARHGLLEEALQHALLGGDVAAAVRLIAEHRHALMDSEQWQLLERCLRLFPAAAVADYPDLLLAQAWFVELGRSDPRYIREAVDRAAELVARITDQPERSAHLSSEIDTLRCVAAYYRADDAEEVIALALRALATAPRAWYFVRASAWLLLAFAYQMAGSLDRAYAALSEGQPEDVAQNGAVHARVAGSRCFVEWVAGDLQAIPQGAAQLLDVAETHHRRESAGWAHYLLSSVAYQRNDLPAAEAHARAVEEMRHAGTPITYLQTAFVYASIYQALGRPDEARQKLNLASVFLRETRSEALVPLAQAFQAELAMMQGDLAAASHWATTIGPYLVLTAMPTFYAPQLTLPKILLAQDTPASRQQAAGALSRLHAFVTSIHNTRFTIEVLALQALLHDAQGEGPEALAALKQAVAMAEPGGFIRLFVDLGPRMANLLARLRQTGVLPGYTGQILQAFSESTSAAPNLTATIPPVEWGELAEPLTDRENEVLALLRQRLSNKEIAQLLIISPQTVKRHAGTIYQKLHAKGRRDAVAKAIRLGLLKG